MLPVGDIIRNALASLIALLLTIAAGIFLPIGMGMSPWDDGIDRCHCIYQRCEHRNCRATRAALAMAAQYQSTTDGSRTSPLTRYRRDSANDTARDAGDRSADHSSIDGRHVVAYLAAALGSAECSGRLALARLIQKALAD
jgi:hypothetical protein